MDVTAAMSSVQTMQATLAMMQVLNFTTWRYPQACTPINGTNYDFIIVGGGTAGSVLAEKLSKNSSISVLLIEAGGYPPLESDTFPGLFPILPRSVYDYDLYAQNDDYTAQNLQNKSVGITIGKMLGGSGSLQHMLYVRGFADDYDQWANILDDKSWSYDEVLPIFKRIEKLVDQDLIESAYYQEIFGTSGTTDLTRESNPINNNFFSAFKELGHNIENVTTTLGFAETLFNIGDSVRQSTSLRYLSLAKSRSNLCMSLFTTATKILIENGAAVGVQIKISNGDTYVLYVNKEVIVSGGAILSPKLLMGSGIGPKSHLEELGIPVLADLPVGQNLIDQPPALVVYQMEESTAPTMPASPHAFSIPTFVGSVAFNSSQTYPDYMTINLVIEHDSTALLQICSNMFKYSNEICQKYFEANKGKTLLFVVNNVMMPKSTGQVLLACNDPDVDPIVQLGTFSDKSDLELLAKSMQDYHKVINTTYFKSVNASMVDLGLCSSAATDEEFWQCYALEMSATMWHYCGTCAMGSVLDSNFRVKGIEALRVVDASSMPRIIRGKIYAAVHMLAERAADFILSTWNISTYLPDDSSCNKRPN